MIASKNTRRRLPSLHGDSQGGQLNGCIIDEDIRGGLVDFFTSFAGKSTTLSLLCL